MCSYAAIAQLEELVTACVAAVEASQAQTKKRGGPGTWPMQREYGGGDYDPEQHLARRNELLSATFKCCLAEGLTASMLRDFISHARQTNNIYAALPAHYHREFQDLKLERTIRDTVACAALSSETRELLGEQMLALQLERSTLSAFGQSTAAGEPGFSLQG